jgi:hypothetical protein
MTKEKSGCTCKQRDLFPLTPTLSLREREPGRPSLDNPNAPRRALTRPMVLPLPEGEGRGEGEQRVRPAGGPQVIKRPRPCLAFLTTAILLAVTCTRTAFALEEATYDVAKEPWEAGLGNHRAVVHVERKADVVMVKIPWRRRDHDPERKQILVFDAASGRGITNVARLHLDRYEGTLAFQPQTAPGDYYIYYLPFTPQPGWGSYEKDYLRPKESDSEPKAWLPRNTDALPRATVVRLEARTDFDSFYPMEVVATPEETTGLLERSAAFMAQRRDDWGVLQSEGRAPEPLPYLLFPEDRRFPIRMTDELPLRWVKSGPGTLFRGQAQRNEFYVFQIGVWAAQWNLVDTKVEFRGDIAKWLNCFNTAGTNWDGNPFEKVVDVPKGKVQALWMGVDVPRGAKPGEYRATVTIHPANAPPAAVQLALRVSADELLDRGDGEPWRLARLRWLDSRLGIDDKPTQPYALLARDHGTTIGSSFRAKWGDSQTGQSMMPAELSAAGQEILSGPVGLFIGDTSPFAAGGGFGRAPGPPPEPGKPIAKASAQFEPSLRGSSVPGSTSALAKPSMPVMPSGSNSVRLAQSYGKGRALTDLDFLSGITAKADPDGTLSFTARLDPVRDFKISNFHLDIPLRPELATYFMGIGLHACYTPTNYTWHWEGPYNSFWIGNTHAGLHVKLLGSTYEGPMQNLYRPKPAPSWFNEGKGGVTITNGPKGEVLVRVFTGPLELKKNEVREFKFALLVTPVKPLDPATHFRERYWHSTHDIPADVNVINVHHATAPNPFINYPFLAVDNMREFCRTNQAAGRKVKIYYTVRELTSRLPELWALRSLGDEALAGGGGGGYPWLREHLGSGYSPAWYTEVEGSKVDAAIVTSGASRLYNFYVEGINWLARNVPIDGLYLDDVAYDGTVLKRVRKVLDRAQPGCLIDLHSNTEFSIGPANQYTEFFPYVNRLWFGEGFHYDAMSPVQWLVECSGIPFGLMGDMLQDGGNRWRGMLFGMTARLPWEASGPRPVWKIWDEFGIGDSRMVGWWEKECPVRTGREDVLATAYAKPGKTLIALASWALEKAEVRLQLDWKALGLDASKARLVAPEVKDFQPAREWKVDEPIAVEPKRGWLIYVAQ